MMATVGFRVSTTLRIGVSAPLDHAQVLGRFSRRFSLSPRVRAPFEFHEADKVLGPFGRKWSCIALDKRLGRMEMGERLRIVSANAQRFKVHAFELDPVPVHDVPGTLAVRSWVAVLREKWPAARLAGTCVCKPDGGGKCNGHEDCAACDDFDTWEHMREQYAWATQHSEEDGGSYHILGDRIWTYGPPRTYSARGEHLYTGDYHYHLHRSFDDGICGIACRSSSEWPR